MSKTTTIRILSGLLRPTSGDATVADVDVVRYPEEAKRVVGYMPDIFGVYHGMRVWEYLDFFGAAYRMSRAARRPRIDEVLHITGTDEMRDYFVDSLSRSNSLHFVLLLRCKLLLRNALRLLVPTTTSMSLRRSINNVETR